MHGQVKRIAQEIEKNSTDEFRPTTYRRNALELKGSHKEGIRKMALK